jgi:hypothetical protein
VLLSNGQTLTLEDTRSLEKSLLVFVMVNDHVTTVERIWRVVLETPEKRYEDFIAVLPEAKAVIDSVCAAAVYILNLRRVSSKSNVDGAVWLKLAEDAEENRKAACQHIGT